MTPARRAALAALRATLNRGEDIQKAVDRQVPGLRPQDTALATALTYGTVRLLGRLDALLSLVLPRLDKFSRQVRRLLEMAAYELLFLRTPTHATRSWAVPSARRLSPGLAGVVHAALLGLEERRHLAEDRQAFTAAGGAIHAWYSLPAWIWELWQKEYGDHAHTLAAMSLTQAPIGLRLRPAGSDTLRQELAPAACRQGKLGLAFTRLPQGAEAALHSGRAVRQSLASQEALLALEPTTWPQPVWDACAGRGGKALLLADLGLQTLASDPNLWRLEGLRRESQRLGTLLPCVAADGRQPPLRLRPGTILLDAPCTGLGVLARRPDIRWKRTPKDMGQLTALQAQLLDAAAATLAPGGRIAYITCTLTQAENMDQVRAFLQRHPDFCLRQHGTTPWDWGEVFFFALMEHAP